MLLHGGGQTRHSWAGAMRSLVARGYHVLNLDARGHGDSDWSQEQRYTLEDLAADLRAAVGTLPAPPALVGASLGAATALELVGRSATPLASCLVLVDLVPQTEEAGVQRIRAFMGANAGGFASVEEAADAVAAYRDHENLRQRADGRLYHTGTHFLDHMRRDTPEHFRGSWQRAVASVRRYWCAAKSDIVGDTGVADCGPAAAPGGRGRGAGHGRG
jgi:pimeloyl-ACP methyl ester carboxylesterase